MYFPPHTIANKSVVKSAGIEAEPSSIIEGIQVQFQLARARIIALL
jgi:hypothetical protein